MSKTSLDLLSVPGSEKGQTLLRPFSDPSPSPQLHALWLGIHLPRLALEVHTRLETTRPLAVIDGEDRLHRVLVCDARAAALGARPGLGLNVALALAPQPRAIARAARREQAALVRLAGWAGQFTPRVSLTPPDALLLEVRGSLALFGGVDALRALASRGVAALGYTTQLAFAPTPLAALWLARAGEETSVTAAHALAGRLAAIPLGCLRWPDAVHESLHGMGVRVVGDCLRLPRDGFARRFGAAQLADLDRALGKRPDPRQDYASPVRFSTQLELPIATQTLEPVQHALALLLEELCGYLRARDGAVRLLQLGLVHHAGPVTEVRLELMRPSRAPPHWLELFMTRLDCVALREPVLALRLRSGDVLPADTQTPELFGERPRAATNWHELIERLRARLGTNAVHGLSVIAEHRPETAWREAEPGTASVTGDNRERPLWMLVEPRPLEVVEGMPCLEGRLDLLRGPERIESGWWDGADVKRDYYVARNSRGMRLWIYRNRTAPPTWFLQGLFG